jgi:hypothetical protein
MIGELMHFLKISDRIQYNGICCNLQMANFRDAFFQKSPICDLRQTRVVPKPTKMIGKLKMM